MSKRLISVALTVLAGSAVVSGVACSSSNSPPDNTEAGASSSSSGGTTSSSSSSSGSASSSSSSGGGDSGGADASSACTATITGMLIDDQSISTGTQITASLTFAPTGCGTKGTWFSYPAGMITPSPFAFSARPNGEGGAPAGGSEAGASEAGTSEAGASDAAREAATEAGGGTGSDAGGSSGGDGGAAGPMAACVSGSTGQAQYSTSGMGLNFGTIPGTDAGSGNALQVLMNASSFTGIQFQAYGLLSTPQSIILNVPDKNETPGEGPPGAPSGNGTLYCDPTNTSGTACGGANKTITINPGPQTIQVPFAMIVPNPGFGENNETMLDPSSLTQIQWQIQQPVADAAAGVPFNFCIYNVSFY